MKKIENMRIKEKMIRITKQNIINHIDRDPETETNTVEEKIIKELIKQKK
jgi:hypothetical protein